jgi:hypothetical protein
MCPLKKICEEKQVLKLKKRHCNIQGNQYFVASVQSQVTHLPHVLTHLSFFFYCELPRHKDVDRPELTPQASIQPMSIRMYCGKASESPALPAAASVCFDNCHLPGHSFQNRQWDENRLLSLHSLPANKLSSNNHINLTVVYWKKAVIKSSTNKVHSINKSHQDSVHKLLVMLSTTCNSLI